MSNIGIELAQQAKKKGICDEWFTELRTTNDTDKLIDMYLRGIDFCLSNEFPSNDYIRKNFVGKMEAYGVHLDEKLDVSNPSKLVALGTCTGDIEINEYTVSQLFVKHDSFLNLFVKDNGFAMVDIFDNSILTVVADGDSKVCINHYGGEVNVIKKGNAVVKIIEKHKKTY